MNTAAHAGSPTQLVLNPVAKEDDRRADEFAYDRPRTEEPNLCCPNIQVCSSLYLSLPLYHFSACLCLLHPKSTP